MTANELKVAGQALYGERWQSPLARDLDMSDRHMRRLVDGSAAVNAGMAADIQRLLRLRHKLIARILAA